MLYSLHIAIRGTIKAVRITLLDRVEQAHLLLIIIQRSVIETSLRRSAMLVAHN